MTLKQFFTTTSASLIIVLALSLPFTFTDLDIVISSFFYKNGWIYGEQPIWHLLYHYGIFPGLFLAITSLLFFCLSWFKQSFFHWKLPTAIILLTLLLGPGLLVNVIGKGYWGRPRPRDITVFNGSEPFHRWTQPGIPGKGKSFPSGHPSVGYLFCVFFFLESKSKRRWLWLSFGIGFGTIMGMARIIQGGHFASDVLWSGGFTFISAALSTYLVSNITSFISFSPMSKTYSTLTNYKRPLILGIAIISSACLITFFLLATPFYKEHTDTLSFTNQSKILITTSEKFKKVTISFSETHNMLESKIEFHGFGFPKLKLLSYWKSTSTQNPNILNAYLFVTLKGWTTEKSGVLNIRIPKNTEIIWSETNPKTHILYQESTTK